jgi:hypothetical protein
MEIWTLNEVTYFVTNCLLFVSTCTFIDTFSFNNFLIVSEVIVSFVI